MTRFNAAKSKKLAVSFVGEMKLILTTHFFYVHVCMPTYFNLRNATKEHSDSEARQI